MLVGLAGLACRLCKHGVAGSRLVLLAIANTYHSIGD